MPSALDQRPAPPSAAPRPAPSRRRTRVLALPEARWAAGRDRSVPARAAPPVDRSPRVVLWGPLYAAVLRHRWLGTRLGGPQSAQGQDAGRRPADDRRGARGCGDRTGDGRCPPGRHLRHLGALEALATARTADSVRGLLDLAPATATRLNRRRKRGDRRRQGKTGGGRHHPCTARRTRRRRRSCSATGPVTWTRRPSPGEPLPVAKCSGDEVFAGTVNGTGALRVRVERDASGLGDRADRAGWWGRRRRPRRPRSCSSRRSSSGTRWPWWGRPSPCSSCRSPSVAELTGSLLRAMTFMIVASPRARSYWRPCPRSCPPSPTPDGTASW